MPVETNSGSSLGSKSFGERPSAAASLFLLNFGGLEGRFFLRHGDALGPAILETDFHGKNAGAGLLHDVDSAFLRGNDAEFRQKKPGSDDGMPGEFQFFFGGENAQARECAVIRRFLHEDRFREIHFAGDGQHLVVREAVAIGDNGQGIALESRGGENIQSVEAMIPLISVLSVRRCRAVRVQMRSSWADRPFIDDIAGVQSCFWFEQENVHFFVGDGASARRRAAR